MAARGRGSNRDSRPEWHPGDRFRWARGERAFGILPSDPDLHPDRHSVPGRCPDRRPTDAECGNEPASFAHDHPFSIRYYLIAVLFVIFDVETIFLFPWAVVYDRLALFGFVEMMVFLGILVVGYIFVWKRGALNWA